MEDNHCSEPVRMYGVKVCKAGAVHCNALPPTDDSVGEHQHVAHNAPNHTACGCTGATPCLVTESQQCVALDLAGQCPTDALQCNCLCGTAAKPCQHDSLELCLAADTGGQCPAGTTMTASECALEALHDGHHDSLDALAAAHDRACTCGAAAPCMSLTGAAVCFERKDASVCPENTKECSCTCAGARPCLYTVNGKDYCFALASLDGEWNCQAHMTDCNQRHLGTSRIHDPPDTLLDTAGAGAGAGAAGAGGCTTSGWSAWSACTKDCGSGTQFRLPLASAGCAGSATASLSAQHRACSTAACVKVDCAFSGWTSWGVCSMDCDGGVQERRPVVLSLEQHGGRECPAPIQRHCNAQACVESLHGGSHQCDCTPGEDRRAQLGLPVDDAEHAPPVCVLGADGAMQVRTPPSDQLFRCMLTESHGCLCCLCSQKSCALGEWSAWSACVGGQQEQHRGLMGKVLQAEDCPVATHRRMCGGWNTTVETTMILVGM
jgi:hypothetical protein